MQNKCFPEDKTMTMIKKVKWLYIILSTVLVILGIAVIAFPETSSLVLCYVAAAGLVVYGLIKIVGYFRERSARVPFRFDFAVGFAVAAAGILLAIFARAVISAFVFAIGICLLISSALKFQTGIDAKRFGFGEWWLILVGAVLSLAAGIFLLIDPIGAHNAMMIVSGVCIVYMGLQNILTVIYIVHLSHMVNTEKRIYEFD